MKLSRLTWRIASGTLLLLLCTACSKTPSGGEINAAVAGMLSGQCKPAHVENIKLINGAVLDERRYQAKIGFDVVIASDPKVQPLWAELNAVQARSKEREARYATEYKQLDETLSASLQTMQKRLNEMNDQADKERGSSPEREELRLKARDQFLARTHEKDDQLAALSRSHDEDQRAIREQFKGLDEIKAVVLNSGCNSWSLKGQERDLVLQTLASNSERGYDAPRAYYKAFGEGARQSFTLEITMIKTDNGWRASL